MGVDVDHYSVYTCSHECLSKHDRREAVTTLVLFASRIINLRANDTASRAILVLRWDSVSPLKRITHRTRIGDWSCVAIEDWNSTEEDKIARFRGPSLCFQSPIDCAISISVSNTRATMYNLFFVKIFFL